jgi:hypothetical protein
MVARCMSFKSTQINIYSMYYNKNFREIIYIEFKTNIVNYKVKKKSFGVCTLLQIKKLNVQLPCMV